MCICSWIFFNLGEGVILAIGHSPSLSRTGASDNFGGKRKTLDRMMKIAFQGGDFIEGGR